MSVHGTSAFVQSSHEVFAEAEFQDFAPAPCVCCSCLAPDVQKQRQYFRIFDNRMELNAPLAPFMCCTCDEKCIADRVLVSFHDRVPSRAGMFCWVIPCTCCGPPVIFVKKPKCLCIDCTDNFGETIMAAPCECFCLRRCLCFGPPCYMQCALPIMPGVKNGSQFLAKWRQALDKYFAKTGIDSGEKAKFDQVTDNALDVADSRKEVPQQ